MSKTVKRLLWQRTLDRTVLRQPLPKAMPPERLQRDIGQQTKAFLDAIGRAIAEMSKPRAMGLDMAAGKDMTCVALGAIKAGEPPLLLEVRQRRYEWKVLEPARGGPASLQSQIDDFLSKSKDELRREQDRYMRRHLCVPYPAGGEHKGGVRLVGERGPEREISWSKSPFLPQSEQVVVWPRRAGKATARQALEAARREQWRREHERDMKQPVSFVFDDLEGSSCD